MIKSIYILFFLSCFVNNFSQNNSTVFYTDTVFKFNELRFHIKGAFSDKKCCKIPLEITNLTDSFKIIKRKNCFIFNTANVPIAISELNDIVIPPNSNVSAFFTAKENEFKSSILKFQINKISISTSISNIYNPPKIILNSEAFENCKKEKYPKVTVGLLDIYLKKFKYPANGNLQAMLLLFYHGDKFIGIQSRKIKVQTTNGEVYINSNQFTQGLHSNNTDEEIVLRLEFDTKKKSKELVYDDMIILSDLLYEYETKEYEMPCLINLSLRNQNQLKSEDKIIKELELLNE